MSRPEPIDEAKRPTTTGSMARPDLVGDMPITPCRKSGRKMIAPNMATPERKPKALPIRNIGVAEEAERDDRLGRALLDQHEEARRRGSTPTTSASEIGARPAVGLAGPVEVEQQRGDRGDDHGRAEVVDLVLAADDRHAQGDAW